MTSEEKQEIINAVLAALRTNSKSIDQLTPVSEMSDTDFLELNGGRKVSYGVLFANHMSNDQAQEAWEYLDENKVDKDSRGLVEVHQAPVVFLDAMGELDGHALTGNDGLEYRPSSKLIYDFPGGLFGAPKAGAVYISKNNLKKFVWNGTDLEELKVDECPLFVDYSEPVSFATLPVGGSYYVPSSHKIAVKIDASNTKTYDPLPDALYFFRDKGMIYTWKSSANKWVPAGSDINVVNNLTDGGEADALSAEMGKTLMVAIQQILGALGNYAFPGGKPTIDWGGSSSVTYTVTYPTDSKVTHTGAGDTVELGSSLEVTLGIASGNDLYVIKDSSVKVYMGGVEQGGAYNASSQKVTLAAVTGNVVIVAEAWTYVSRGLVMHLDGKNRGGVAGHWKSLVNYNNGQGFNDKIDFTLTNCDETHSDYVAFDGDPNGNDTGSKAIANISLLDVSALTGTIEAGYANAEVNSAGGLCVMHNALGSGNRICLSSWRNSSVTSGYNYFLLSTSPVDNTNNTGVLTQQSNVTGGGFYSFVLGSYKRNGYDIPGTLGNYTQTTVSGHSILSLFWRKTAADNVQYSKGRLYSLRVYSVQLDDDERAQNLAIDQKRFNLA